ncbi:MAG: hypothetical protein KA327_07855 [Pseudarcicella sp.]|nr:hypothetical protein [Pseudarcicella sp.]
MKKILFILLAFFSFSCEKDETPAKIEFYEILNYNEIKNDSTGIIDFSKVSITKNPVIENSDIVSYKWADHTINFTEQGRDKLKAFYKSQSTSNILLLKVNGESIYTTMYESAISSSAIVGHIHYYENEDKSFSLSFNEDFRSPLIKDKRDNEKLKKALEESGRLK